MTKHGNVKNCFHFKGNGYINVSDLRDILRALDDNVSEDELDEMITEIDTDGSGTVDFDGER
ncbi:MAG: EF-hand domain-containing protein [Gammaproteobacteria bacterium]|nr:EF-hand domain-containing protein [Gammaproteobacteria bacterium]